MPHRQRKPLPKPSDASVTQTPLEYMLGVMNDPTASETRRDRLAIAAAQYVHQRAADTRRTKRHHDAAEAKRAGAGTPWAGDLDGDWPQ
jgi:hypothetical protein